MYVNLDPLVKSLSHFDPRKDPIYYGRSGSPLEEPRRVMNTSLIGKPGRRYFFAVGGIYCLSRALLEQATPYLVWVTNFASIIIIQHLVGLGGAMHSEILATRPKSPKTSQWVWLWVCWSKKDIIVSSISEDLLCWHNNMLFCFCFNGGLSLPPRSHTQSKASVDGDDLYAWTGTSVESAHPVPQAPGKPLS